VYVFLNIIYADHSNLVIMKAANSGDWLLWSVKNLEPYCLHLATFAMWVMLWMCWNLLLTSESGLKTGRVCFWRAPVKSRSKE